ncbi:MAG: metallophosphoesterase family protein [Nanobdellota archaeon]
MKALIFGDTHGDIFALELLKEKAKKVDVVFCLGDITIFGEEYDLMMTILEEFNKPVYYIHGNHETIEETELLLQKHPSITFIHKKQIELQGYSIIGYGGDGFSIINEEFETFIENQPTPNKKTIFLLHGPPANTTLDIPFEDHHSGSESYRKHIEQKQPLAVFAGHIHECEGAYDTIGKTTLHNPGIEGTIVDFKIMEEQHDNNNT